MSAVATIGHVASWETTSAGGDATPVSSLRADAFDWVTAGDPTPFMRQSRPAEALQYMTTLQPLCDRCWTPWRFVPDVVTGSLTISSIGLGAVAGGVVLHGRPTVLDSTELLPGPRVARLINPAQLTIEPTPFARHRGLITFRAPGTQSRRLWLSDLRPDDDLASPLPTGRLTEAREALADLQRWLNMTREQVAALSRVSLRTSRYWDAGAAIPRPTTIRHLLDVHGFVGSLVRAKGLAWTRSWLRQRGADGMRVDELATVDGLQKVTREARPHLFPRRRQPELPPPDAIAAEYEASAAAPYEPTELAPPRRRRRRPPPQ